MYSARVAALTIGATTKWVDNALSHHSLVGVEQGTRGVQRKLNDEALLALALCKMLTNELGVPLANAVSIANQMVAERASGSVRYEVAPGVALSFMLGEIERTCRARLRDAAEAVAHVRRGRPPHRARGPE